MPAYFTYRNLADGVALGGATSIAGFPLSNMQVRQLSTVARISLLSQAVTMDFGTPVRPDVVAMLGTNATMINSYMRIGYSTDGTAWTDVNSPTVSDSGARSLPRNLYATAPVPAAYRYWRVAPAWQRVGNAGYYELGRLWFGNAIVVDNGVDGDFEMDFTDPGTLTASSGGQMYENPRPRLRVLRCNVSAVSALAAYGFPDGAAAASDVPSFQGMQLEAGTTGEVIVIPRSRSSLWMQRTAIYGHVDSGGRVAIRKIAGDNYNVSATIIEER